MKWEEIQERLKSFEWNDIEFKEARQNVPKSSYETVSAFANTEGGWIVLGIRENQGHYEISGVSDPDRLLNDFLTALRSGKLNRNIDVKEYRYDIDGKVVLAFQIPESKRQDKPVYLDGNIRHSYVRRGSGDERCTQNEIERFLREASQERYDGGRVELDPEHCFDSESVRWYRSIFQQKNPASEASLSDLEFLHQWGLVVEAEGKLSPTRASILLLGTESALRALLPRPIVDCPWIHSRWTGELPEPRWSDRLILEVNLIQCWRQLLNRYTEKAEKAFSVDPETLQRQDLPPGYLSFREAAINLLIHQDLADHNRTPRIYFYADRTIFWNPGDAFAATEELLEPKEKEVRNPRIVSAFRRIGLSEQAGTGIRSIYKDWRSLGHVPPIIQNNRSDKAFELTLIQEPLLSDEQIRFQKNVGVQLSQEEAEAFALICREGSITLTHAKTALGTSGAKARGILEHLITQGLVQEVHATPSSIFALSDHLSRLKEQPTGSDRPASSLVTEATPLDERLVTDQALPNLTESQWKVLLFCKLPKNRAELMDYLGVTHRSFFGRSTLDPLIAAQFLRMTHPDNPNHPNQAYVLTQEGVRIRKAYMKKHGASEGNNK